MNQVVDWKLAANAAKTLMPAGPKIFKKDAARIVEELRIAAGEGLAEAEKISKLTSTAPSQTLVVDRAGWAKAVSQNFAAMLPAQVNVPAMVPAVAGAELGAVLSVLGTRVLGQFDPFVGPRLLLNAPTITQIRGELNLNARDFYLWIATHEQTHRLQFEHAPWIPEVMKSILAEAFGPLENEGSMNQLGERLKSMKSEVGELTSIMSVLEGHAMVVMNDVTSIGSIKTIRRRFEARGENRSVLATLLGKLLGLDAKALQYKRGAKFVRHVVDGIGYEGFNQVFSSRELFPSAEELDNPERWLARTR
ncbi:zinc-dependent metalloprotease [Glutamicibacter sp. JL.03c]|uniref:zinc-dependent metalloprotease n=1 Tax=Glutamicibacter sp. JL.03c TaxID=2984842 RepID=UPI0021F6F70C|nr:zinc-dependent metalloprotease [Glutamicibacter sp. JL.03c]UYQ77687.1 zinc-dependent metalloprotease [Glutamicibacter sp. JL.03c]